MKCTKCGEETKRTYDGLCAACLSIRAGDNEKKKIDKENSLYGLELNTPIGDDFKRILKVGQGNFRVAAVRGPSGVGEIIKESIKQTAEQPVKVVKTDECVYLSYRPSDKARFMGTAELSRWDGSDYGISGDNVWYFSRLFVPEQLRGQGVASKLMQELKRVMTEDKMTVICEVNPYGDLDKAQLTDMYKEYGFKDEGNGFLVFRG